MAGISACAQAPASSSGTVAPSRKLNAERAWSSTKGSVIAALHEPTTRPAIQPVQRAIGKRDVPFVAHPRVGGPPVTRAAPRSGKFQHLAANTLGRDKPRLSGSQRHARHPWRPKNPQANSVTVY